MAIAALSRALADPQPKILHGTAKSPGIFIGSATGARKDAANLCLQNGWIEATGHFQVSGRTKKELYRITPKGVHIALDNGETTLLLRDMLAALDKSEVTLTELRAHVAQVLEQIASQKNVLSQLGEKIRPPNLATRSWPCEVYSVLWTVRPLYMEENRN